MRWIVKAVRQRAPFVDYLARHIAGLEVVWDSKRSSLATMHTAVELAGDDPAVHMEEDIIVTRQFQAKLLAAVAEHPRSLIQFFSMRKKDLTVGSRWDASGTYLMNQCFYAPPGMSRAMAAYFPVWAAKWAAVHPGGPDIFVRMFLQSVGIKRYWIHCPSLVDHRVAVSAIDPRRSSRRQSFTFADPQT